MNMLAPDLSIERIETVVVCSDCFGALRLPRDDHDRPIETLSFTKRKRCKWLPSACGPNDRLHRQSRHCAATQPPSATGLPWLPDNRPDVGAGRAQRVDRDRGSRPWAIRPRARKLRAGRLLVGEPAQTHVRAQITTPARPIRTTHTAYPDRGHCGPSSDNAFQGRP
jgi:hypothetical protein